MFKQLKKYIWPIAALLSTLLVAGHYYQVHKVNWGAEMKSFNENFHQLDDRIQFQLNRTIEEVNNDGIHHQWNMVSDKPDVFIHIYRNDSLKYWNSNQLPILRFAEIHFPEEGILHLQNGWYYTVLRNERDLLIAASVLIKRDYSYENDDLINGFAPELGTDLMADVGIDKVEGYPISDKRGNYVFSVIPNDQQVVSKADSVILLCLVLLAATLWLFWITSLLKNVSGWSKFGLIVLVAALRIASIKLGWLSIFSDEFAFNPMIYGSNSWFPNVGEYLLNVLFLTFILFWINDVLANRSGRKTGKWFSLLVFLMVLPVWMLNLYFIQDLINNSTIPLSLDELFTTDTFTLLILVSWGVLFYIFFRLLQSVSEMAIKDNWHPAQLSVISFIWCCIYIFYELNYGTKLLLTGLLPMFLYGIVLFLAVRSGKNSRLGVGLLILSIFTLVLSVTMNGLNDRKEREERKVYANLLATDKNIETELEFQLLKPVLPEDKFLKSFLKSPGSIGSIDFHDNMERRFFNNYWERYELGFELLDTHEHSVLASDKVDTSYLTSIRELIAKSGELSELDSSLYYIRDFSSEFNYIGLSELFSGDTLLGTLVCTMKSKKIPEEIGFPRLLISKEAAVMEPLESYSIAKYHDGKLTMQYGDFNFPTVLSVLPVQNQKNKTFFSFGQYDHLLYRRSASDTVILSRKKNDSLDLVTSISYLFTFFGLLLLPMLFRTGSGLERRTMTLAMKIQLVLVSLVFLSLLAFGWGSGVFIRSQYNSYSNDVITEKLSSVETEVRAKLGDFDHLSIDKNGDYMQFILQKFSRVFFTDINLYDANGYLMATSKPKLFNMGLISDQINPIAFKNLKYGKKSEYVHQERIGLLDYSSAYQPFYSNDGKQLAYINLQHFGQQREFESQIEQFLISIINVFILLLAISILLAIVISNWLTQPLRALQTSFTNLQFGKRNEPISYDKNDEIGALVKEYNQKLEELEFTAEQLARSERESAWREMAKQVAHEIKNPLTPMKLSVQQLLRTYDPQDERSKEKLEKVANSIVEQIDALTNIANEFSNFAKMPRPNEAEVELLTLVQHVVEVFSAEEKVRLSITSKEKRILVKGDKDQLMRVFNNLIKNAIQAIPTDREGLVNITLESKEDTIKVIVQDNGTGIEKDKQSKIFVPYFTTKSTGTGLGLAMVKQIVENHGGWIDFETTPGVGTSFIFEIRK